MSEGGCKLEAIRVGFLEQAVEDLAGGAQLLLHGLFVVVGPRPFDRLQGRLRPARCRREGQADGEGRGGRHYGRLGPRAAGCLPRHGHGVPPEVDGEPCPRTRVTYLPALSTSKTSVDPSGQRAISVGGPAGPATTITRGSLADA